MHRTCHGCSPYACQRFLYMLRVTGQLARFLGELTFALNPIALRLFWIVRRAQVEPN